MKRILSILTALLTAIFINAQEYHHGIGVGANRASYTFEYSSSDHDYSGMLSSSFAMIFYKSTFKLEDNLAISAYPAVSLGIMSTNSPSVDFGFHVPINMEYYFGRVKEGAFFIGGGLNYGYQTTPGSEQNTVIGPQITIGYQKTFSSGLYGIRGAYTQGLNKTKLEDESIVASKDSKYIISCGIYYVFGSKNFKDPSVPTWTYK